MMRLADPQYTYDKTLDECHSGITGNNSLKKKLNSNKKNLTDAGDNYSELSRKGELYLIKAINSKKGDDPVVLNDLKKSELMKFYDTYFVPEDKPTRAIYDYLLNSAKEKCPFCGGIGTPRNLDHFLPKSQFPQFSIYPRNLVPSCRDCNMDGNPIGFSETAEDQIIQPYLDDDRFFLEQWIHASYSKGVYDPTPGNFTYFTKPPAHWCDIDKKRVEKHFVEFNIAQRYSTKAAEHLGIALGQLNYFIKKTGVRDDDFIRDFFKSSADAASFPNHWQKGMYQALIDAILLP
ncbi:HNH endonuclease [Duganella sp. FT3S]|uniref:HNH endonuclease n=1 Tax=Rugamonas fusca TaxID=2758568 RepID=A0A7W2EG77_9BURK|nr:HNH endonuclease [Rugamonas fusca]MBA5605377.1 HNH endonuclease [Rugamonas fusca]